MALSVPPTVVHVFYDVADCIYEDGNILKVHTSAKIKR